ncbi:MAG: ATP-binding protein [Rubrivivax sp.]|jgi:two-component system osmolarity sensor histidine kinase EnvZ
MRLHAARFKLFWHTLGWLALGFGATGFAWWLAASWRGLLVDEASVWTNTASDYGAFAAATAASLAALALTAWQVNRPYLSLSQATQRFIDGDPRLELDEQALVREIRAVNAGFNRMARELARAEQDRAVMLAGLSHDLRTPLARLRLEAEMSVTDPQALADMAADIGQLDSIIDKFAEYARPEVPQPRPVDLRQLLLEVKQCFAGDARLTIALALPEDAVVRADPTELRRVLVNLLENAARYARPGGGLPAELTASAAVGAHGVELVLQDTGPGVPEAQLGLLTQPFFRGDAARTEVSGAGLGLAIVDRAVQRMRGTLTLRNRPGRGLEVRIHLPRAAQPGRAAPAQAPTG